MKRCWQFIIITLLALTLSLASSNSVSSKTKAVNLVREARQEYQKGEFKPSLEILQQAEREFIANNQTLQQAQIQALISLNQQKLGNWQQAQQVIDYGLALIATEKQTKNKQQVLGQIWNAQGHLHIRKGNPTKAIEDWQKAEKFYQSIDDIFGIKGITIARTQALENLGFYRRSCNTIMGIFATEERDCQKLNDEQLTSLLESVGERSDRLEIEALSSFANSLMLLGRLEQAERVINKSHTLFDRLNSEHQFSLLENKLNFTIANIARSQANLALERDNNTKFIQQFNKAIAAYRAILQNTNSQPTTDSIEAKINLLNIYIKRQKWDLAKTIVEQNDLNPTNLPLNYRTLKTQLILAGNLSELKHHHLNISQSWDDIAQQYQQLARQARNIENYPLEASALGYLGELAYQHPLSLDIDPQLQIERALNIAQINQAPEIAYRWQWQLGKIYRDRGETTKAITAYEAAFNTLQDLRSDLVALDREIQFSFRQQVEPVYREYTKLLLVEQTPERITAPDNLRKARDVIESLQIAELDNYFQDACLTSQKQNIEDIDPHAAVIYTIVLPGDERDRADRLEVILSLSDGSFQHRETIIPHSQMATTIDTLNNYLLQPDRLQDIKSLSSQVYDWLVRPLEDSLQTSPNKVNTLVFVLDGALQNLPMSALYDGKQYLVSQYAIAVTPGLRLLNSPQSLAKSIALTGGVSQQRDPFPPLENVKLELDRVNSTLNSQNLLDSQFNSDNFVRAINSQPFSIVHLATHGQFSSNPEDTFILLWDRQLTLEDFSELLQNRDLETTSPIDLLVLSACETAKGDNRATLGLAGMSVRTGVNTTLATLWQVNDLSTAFMMDRFYYHFNQDSQQTKAEALRLAQLDLQQVTQKEWDLPLFWAAYVIVGNWL